MAVTFIAIGSNLGNRHRHCQFAVDALRRHVATQQLRESRWRDYPALTLDPSDVQPNFLNGVVQLETALSPEMLLAYCLTLEQHAGRHRITGERWQPRPLDLDIIAYDDLVLDAAELTIPHPELHHRVFVLEPLCDLAPDWEHPLLHHTAEQLLAQVLRNP